MKKLLWFLAIMVFTTSSAFAQLTSSSLTGTVAGPDGALIPGATVVLRSNGTATEVTTTTNDEGSFRFANLDVGAYTVTITADGFKTFKANNIKIEISKEFSLAARLEVGGLSEVVNVSVGEEIINSTDGEINSNVSRKQLDDLPSLGRNPLNFVPLQPGAASPPGQGTVINGVRTSATNTTIDGINVQDNFIRSNATDFSPARPTVDEIEEFAVTTQADASSGFGGPQIQFATRRGTNDFHFRLFEFNRNSELAANSFFNNANGIERPFRNLNQFGGSVSGPLPFLRFGQGGPTTISGKDKLFFFFSYEKLIDRQPAAAQFSTTLTSPARQGIFTYVDNAGVTRQVNLFSLGTGITGIDPAIASRILARLPQGNSTQVGDQRNTTGFSVIQNFNTDQSNYAGSLTYKVNPLNTINGTFRFARNLVNRADIDNSFDQNPGVTSGSDSPFFSVGLTSAISSRFTNEIRGGRFSTDPSFLRQNALQANSLGAADAVSLVTNPEVNFENQGRTTTTYNIQDNATFLAGNHGLSFGGQYQNVNVKSFAAFSTVPTFTIGTGTATPAITTAQFTNAALFPGGISTAQRNTANSLLALLGGIVSGGSQTFNVTSRTSGFIQGAPSSNDFVYDIIGAYVADQWRVTRNLTLNLGVRYDRYSALKDSSGLGLEPVISDPDNIAASLLDPNGRYQFTGGNVGSFGQYYNPDKNNFSPILSFAYAPKFEGGIGGMLFGADTVLRGAYRISYINDETIRAPDNAVGGNQGLSLTSNAFNGNSTALNARLSNLPAIPTPVFAGDNRTFRQNNTAAGNFGTVFAVDPNIETPSVQEYSFGIQRDIGFNTALEIRYVGTRSNNLVRGLDLNQTIINENGFLADFNRARANQLQFGTAACTATQAASTGCQQLTVFPNIAGGGLLTNGTITGLIDSGQVAQLASVYVQNNLQGSVQFVPNTSAGVVDLLTNGSKFRYNALQVDLRRRFSQGLALNANYTFSKNLTDGVGTGQTRFEPFLDINRPELEYARADYDQTHKFNLLASYDLPFGKGRPYLNNGFIGTLLGNFNVGGILQIGSGAPITIVDPNGTFNRSGRSTRQTALTSLSEDELRNLIGVFKTPNGVFFINPSALGRNDDGSINSAGGGTGRGSNGLSSNPFTGQVFFNNTPGNTSSLGRALFNGPTVYNLDMTVIKRFVVREGGLTFQVQADFFNVLNRPNFFAGQLQNINSTNFGRISSTATDARITQLAFRVNF